jgi:archaellum biogenesis ATPase FlaH
MYTNVERFIEDLEGCLDIFICCKASKKLENSKFTKEFIANCLNSNKSMINKLNTNSLILKQVKQKLEKRNGMFELMLNLLNVLNKDCLTIDDFQYVIYNPKEVLEALQNNKPLFNSNFKNKGLLND